MKAFKEINSQGMFYFKDLELPGVISTKQNESIEINISVNYEIKICEEMPLHIPFIHGILRNENTLVTLIDPVITKSFWSSYGINGYTIRSNVMVIGSFIENIENFKLDNISFISSDFNKIIGNSLLTAKNNTLNNIWNLEIHDNKTINLGTSNGISLQIDSFYNFGKYSLKTKFTIEQINSLKFGFKNELNIYDTIRFITTIANMLSFLFQKDVTIDEVVYHSDEEVNGKTISTFKHIYFSEIEREIKEFDPDESLLEINLIMAKIGKYIFNWIELTKAIGYLNYFIRLYNSNKYIDQRIIGQINMIEALHKHFYGTKKGPEENDVIVKRICEQLELDSDKKIIVGLFQNKDGFGLKRKIADIAKKAEYKFEDDKMIDRIITIRSSFAHGSTVSKITTAEYIGINKALTEIINRVLILEMEKDNIMQ